MSATAIVTTTIHIGHTVVARLPATIEALSTRATNAHLVKNSVALSELTEAGHQIVADYQSNWRFPY